jgi:hypothetical protein
MINNHIIIIIPISLMLGALIGMCYLIKKLDKLNEEIIIHDSSLNLIRHPFCELCQKEISHDDVNQIVECNVEPRIRFICNKCGKDYMFFPESEIKDNEDIINYTIVKRE